MANSRPGQKIKMTSIDELLCVPDSSGTTEIAIRDIYPFENHPFKVLDDEKMDELVESIKENGILTPVIVRKDRDDLYEMISGHRRLHAAKIAGLETLPAIIKEMDDDEAVIYMVDSNLQREEILPSEKAFSYKMKYDAMKRVAGRPKKGQENSAQVGRNLETADILGIQVGESRNQVKRYLRLTELITELLDLVDEKRIPIIVGVEMSFFTRKIQGWIHEYCLDVRIPKWNELADLRSGVPQKDITKENLYEYLNGKKNVPDAPEKIVFTRRKLNQYFPKYMSTPERERIIISLLEKWKEEQDNKRQ